MLSNGSGKESPLLEDFAQISLENKDKYLSVGRRILVENDDVRQVARLRFIGADGV